MKERNRLIYFVITSSIAGLSVYSFIDTFLRFRFLFRHILDNITESIFLFMVFSLLLSITGLVSVNYTSKLLKRNLKQPDPNVLDDPGNNHELLGWKYSVYQLFALSVIGFAIFLLVGPLHENYPLRKFPDGLGAYLLALFIVFLGIILVKDTLSIKRYASTDS